MLQLLKKNAKLIKFAIIGGIGGLVQIYVFDLVYDKLSIYILLSYAIAFLLSASTNYILNSTLNFTDKEANLKGYFKYLSSMAITFLIGEVLIYLFINVIGIYHIIANALVILIIFPVNYIICNKIVWSKSKIVTKQEPGFIRITSYKKNNET